MDPKMLIPKVIFFCMLAMKTVIFWPKYLFTSHIQFQSKSHYSLDLHSKLKRYSTLSSKLDDSKDATLVFHVEEVLLKSSSLFPYFMLVAFEAGGILRAILFFLLYPLVCLLSKEMKHEILVFLCFFGIKADKFRVGRSVLPKFFLEDVGCEAFEGLMNYRRKVAISDLPTVMIEGFLKDYLDIDLVIGRELKVAHGYFVGLMKERKNLDVFLNEVREQGKIKSLVGFKSLSPSFTRELLCLCEDIYFVSKVDKEKWSVLPKGAYPKRLVFHDGRLAFRPTFYSTFIMFLWLPFGLILCAVRVIAAFSLPNKVALPILAFTGMRATVCNSVNPASEVKKSGGAVYACNHRTLLDPVYVSVALMRPVAAVTYSVSRVSKFLSPIKTTPLMRNRERDLGTMQELLCQSDLVVCPEGTTCREPYLLRFSPLFAELSDNIVPVALDMHTSMFYGTTASGLKCLDPLFFLLNPFPTYTIRFLERLPKSYTCSGGKSSIDVANYVQKEIANALGFECTSLTRKQKYLILAGNEGLV